jgi:hypothetical protein
MLGKMVHLEEWVKVTNMKNKYFHASSPCSICRALKVKPVWYSCKTGEVRCTDCFDAEAEHFNIRS